MTWRDGSGRALQDYAHPSVAVDVALLTLDDGRLAVVVHERRGDHETGRYSLPGTFVRLDETLQSAALRALDSKVGVTGRRPEQLRVFDAPERDDRGRVLGVAHVDLVPAGGIAAAPGVLLAPVEGDPGHAVLPAGHDGLAYDHDDVVSHAVGWARALYRQRPDPRGLIGPEFTMLELQRVHESVLGERLVKDTFRRRMSEHLTETGRLTSGSVGKPARIYRRGAATGGAGNPPTARS